MGWKRTVVVVAACLLAPWMGAQQFHGIGASITSSTPASPLVGGSNFDGHATFQIRGIAPSVTSITPAPRFGSQFSLGLNFDGRRHHHFGNHFGAFPVFVPVYTYPYPYGYPGFYPETATPTEADFQQPEPEPPALTVFEHRSTYRPPPVDRSASRDYQRSEESTAAARERRDVEERATEPEEKVADQSPTILVFRDGHQLEIGNYAIQGDTIYNLGGSGPRKIKLSELDLGKTVRLNDERGNEFRLPKNFRG